MRLRSVSRLCFACCCGVYASHFLAFSYPRMRTSTASTIHCIHTTATQTFSISSSADLGQVTNNSVTWNVTLPAYWTVQISIEDASSDEGWSQAVRILHHIPPPPLPPLFFTHGILALYIQNTHLRFKFNQATIMMSAAYHPPSLPSPTPTRKYQN
jgi:hypothetical protein